MATLTSKVFGLRRLERSWNTKLQQIPLLINVDNKRLFATKTDSTQTNESEKKIVAPDIVVDDDDEIFIHKVGNIEGKLREKVYTGDEIEKLRDKSGLHPQHRRMLHGLPPYEEPKFWTHRTVKYQRRMYARYGEASGVNPGIQWPIPHELHIRQEYESIARPLTFHEMVDKMQKQKRTEQEAVEKREREIEQKMANVEKVKEEYLAKIKAKEKDLFIAQERKEKLMEEVRRHFGYKVDIRDERFQEMLEKKEKEQRKAMKEARKAARHEKEMRRLAEFGKEGKVKEGKEKSE